MWQTIKTLNLNSNVNVVMIQVIQVTKGNKTNRDERDERKGIDRMDTQRK